MLYIYHACTTQTETNRHKLSPNKWPCTVRGYVDVVENVDYRYPDISGSKVSPYILQEYQTNLNRETTFPPHPTINTQWPYQRAEQAACHSSNDDNMRTHHSDISQPITQNPWENAGNSVVTGYQKVSYHLSNASICQNVSGMYETKQHLSCLFQHIRLCWIISQLIIYNTM